jgi:hypothetical protein
MAEAEKSTRNPDDEYKCEPISGPGDNDKLQFGIIWQAAALGLTAISAIASGIMLGKQIEIAKQYLAISQGWHDWYFGGYVPLEDREVAEITVRGPTKPFYDAAVGRAKALGELAVRTMAEDTIRCTSQYSTGLRQARLRDAMITGAEALSTMADVGYRTERDRVIGEDAENYARKLQVLNRGREMAADIIKGGNLAAGIFGDLAQAGGANFMAFLGYALKKKETDYGQEIGLGVWRKKRDVGYQGLDEFDDRMGPVIDTYAREEMEARMRPILRQYRRELGR